MGWMGDRWGVTFSDGGGLVFRSCGTREAPNGRCTLIGVADSADNQLTLTRDEHGRLLRIDTPNRRWARLRYDPAGRVVRASDSSGAHVGYEYNDAGQLVRVIRSDGRIDTYEYDARGLMTRMKDVPGMVVENEYNSDGRPIRQVVTYEPYELGTAPPPDVFEFNYVVTDGRVRQTEVVRPQGERYTLTFDAQGYTNREVWRYPDGRSTTIDYIVDTAEQRVTSVLVSCIGSDGTTTPLSARIAPRMSSWNMARILSAQCGVPVLEVDDDR
jgi:YD repeat-containing protein